MVISLKRKLTNTEYLNTIQVTSSNAISKFGDVLFDYINSVFLSSSRNGGFWLALYQSSEILISVFFNFWGGALSDNSNRKKIIWHCDIIAGFICIGLALLVPKVFFVYDILLINVALAILSSFRNPAYKAIFREIVYKEHINEVNSVLEIAKEIVKICGPTGAVIISHFLGNKLALIIDGITFLISGLLIKRLSIITPLDLPNSSKKTFLQIKEGLTYIICHKEILIIILFSSIVNFIIAGYNLILPFSTYAFPNSNLKTYAIFLTAEAVGGLIGATTSTFIKKEPTTNKLVILLFFGGMALVPSNEIYFISHSAIFVSICIAFFNFFLSIYNIQFMTFVQVRTDINYIGRVFGIIFSLVILFMPIGTFCFQRILNLKKANNYILIGVTLVIVACITWIIHLMVLKNKINNE